MVLLVGLPAYWFIVGELRPGGAVSGADEYP
jgi:hypothetical protein